MSLAAYLARYGTTGRHRAGRPETLGEYAARVVGEPVDAAVRRHPAGTRLTSTGATPA